MKIFMTFIRCQVKNKKFDVMEDVILMEMRYYKNPSDFNSEYYSVKKLMSGSLNWKQILAFARHQRNCFKLELADNMK